MTINEGLILQELAYVMLFHAEVTSGHYKTKNVTDGWGREHTEADLLEDHVRTMKDHIDHMGKLIDTLNKDK